jgi:nicotinamide mononucleotide transporter
MNQIIEFFTEPYQNTHWFFILLELVAALFGIVSVFYAKKEDIKVFPTGIISTGLYVYLLSQWQMYGDLIINIYYTLMSIYGWYMWLKIVDNQDNHIRITHSGTMDYLKAGGIFTFTSIFVIAVYRHYEVMNVKLGIWESVEYVQAQIAKGSITEFRKITPYLDTFTTGAAFAAMWLMANKKLESWTFWIIVNIVSVPLYFIKGYGFTAIQYTIFLILAFYGYREWHRRLNRR